MKHAFGLILLITVGSWQVPLQAGPPRCLDPRLVIELVAAEPDIVTPTGIAVDERGRIWAIENNTHERPENYKGYASDRIRIYEDFDSSGRARRITDFADGFKNSMGLALGKEGQVYLATRSALFVLRDSKKQGRADEKKVFVQLETKGQYPHNGLSGFAFDALGNLYFSLGENLGADYRLIGSDGKTLSGGGEGGSIYRCRPDGSQLKRMATGFWNTFHLSFDAFGRLFAVDNDPDSRGPCRLLHIIEGGDYGYRFRNGRKGLHPFTAWNGELPGTLPMAAGTAEAPSGIIAYESDSLPAEYRGQLFVTSWGDHVVERFTLESRGASFSAKNHVLIQGDEDFRPVGIAIGPDGNIYLSDWVDKSYPVHGKGRLWRIRAKEPPLRDGRTLSSLAQLDSPKLQELLNSPRQDLRQAAGELLASRKGSEALLRQVLEKGKDPRARIQALWSARRLPSKEGLGLIQTALKDAVAEIRAEAASLLGNSKEQSASAVDRPLLLAMSKNDPSPYVRMQALKVLESRQGQDIALHYLSHADPFLMGTALQLLGRADRAPFLIESLNGADAKLRLGILLALRRGGMESGRKALREFLNDSDPDIRRAAIQWVGEQRISECADLLEASAAKPPVTRELFEALLASRRFLKGDVIKNPSDEVGGEEFVAQVFNDDKQPSVFRTQALRMIRPDHTSLKTEKLKAMISGSDAALKEEALRTLILRTDDDAKKCLAGIVQDPKSSDRLKAYALVGLAGSHQLSTENWLALLKTTGVPADVLRGLRPEMTRPKIADALMDWWGKSKEGDERKSEELAEQLWLGSRQKAEANSTISVALIPQIEARRPKNIDGWRALAKETGDPEAGERLFFHPNGPRCAVCHRVNGRGGVIGPDLSTIARASSREKLIESILEPSKEIAPQFTSWTITTKNGKTRTGVIIEESFDSTLKVADSQGRIEVLRRLDIEEKQVSKTSIMPDKLTDLMTRREWVDLLAFLMERR